MADKPSDLVQGTLDMLILKTLALEPMHGYGIAVRIEQISKRVFRPNAGSLFMAIQRLQRDGLIKGEWKSSENNRRAKYYVLTDQGRKRLTAKRESGDGKSRRSPESWRRRSVRENRCPCCEI
jgi:PadR family transcriptional regulator, regulatory protein PadR